MRFFTFTDRTKIRPMCAARPHRTSAPTALWVSNGVGWALATAAVGQELIYVKPRGIKSWPGYQASDFLVAVIKVDKLWPTELLADLLSSEPFWVKSDRGLVPFLTPHVILESDAAPPVEIADRVRRVPGSDMPPPFQNFFCPPPPP